MVHPKALIQSSLEGGRDLLRPQANRTDLDGPPPRAPVMVPIRSLGPSHRERIAGHLLALQAHDRYLRFGYAASDEQVQRYVDGLNFDRDDIFGIYNRRLELIAMAHLAFSVDPSCASCSEFGVSVLSHARGRGYGSRLFDRAIMHARNEGVTMMFIHALSENTTMLHIARRAGAVVQRDGSESDAFLKLPPDTLASRVEQWVGEGAAALDYRLKQQGHLVDNLIDVIGEVRQGLAGRAARD